ncbi:acyl-CoA dehydrogenase family protein [Sphingomonas immobilis]|uniref:Acyl-CoA dehydrogenase family protein n=1 Tax=Sphingomonas immobilis TaxID=3063997 RepID=A0ABT9A2I4_9SPHN|nr:acyl-CoA dehydrogenase family protein [Sphingomonas sp. CA1-15]MDO7844051.1 acyl-CoA dehydrogenase family protein [Sphingomonas sp. CA1-15]
MLADSVGAWVARESPVTAFRRVRDAADPLGFDPAAWRSIAAMGWAGIAISEDQGGAGLGLAAAGLIVAGLGRALVASPLAATIAASAAILHGGDEAQRRLWLPSIAEGTAIASIACDEGGHHDPARLRTKAERVASGWRLSGVKPFVAEGSAATLFVVAADTGLFLVPADTQGLAREPRSMMDSRGHASVSLDVTLPADARLSDADLDTVLDGVRALAAAEMLGLADAVFAMTLDYLRVRVQFGRTIGSFQALQHRAATLFTRIELVRSCVAAALAALDARADDSRSLVSLAKAQAGDMLNLVTREAVQMHGGIGMTDEHDVGLYLKRAKMLEGAGGTSAFHRDRYARLNGY